MEFARAQSGHCRSSNITIATFAPRGSFSEDASAAKAQALKHSAASKIRTGLIDTLINKSKNSTERLFSYFTRERSLPIALGRSSEVKLKAAAQRA
jgi:hypothetical protein